MPGKKTANKFTIQFSLTDPAHIQVADILNRQERHGKARYIVEAVTHFLSCGGARSPARFDEKHIETVVGRILRESGADSLPTPFPAGQVENQPLSLPKPTGDVIFDETSEALGEDGFKAVAGALDMFRKK